MKILFFTGSRSEYGIIRPLLKEFDDSMLCTYKLIVSGSHWLESFGNTAHDIKEDHLTGELIELVVFKENKSPGVDEFNSISNEIHQLCQKEKPDFIFITGDRIEAYACAIGAHFAQTDIIHYGGGNLSKGSWDDAYRYNISNLSKYHFVTNPVALQNLKITPSIQNKKNIFNIGSFSVDYLLKYRAKVDTPPYREPFVLVTFHPSVKTEENISRIMNDLIDYLILKKLKIIITYPNTDQGFEEIIEVIDSFKEESKNIIIKKSLGSDEFYRHLRYAKLIIGNSSSSFVEAPYFGNPILNIGKRQEGRISDKIINHCDLDFELVQKWIDHQISCDFEKKNCEQLFGIGNAVNLALKTLKKIGNE